MELSYEEMEALVLAEIDRHRVNPKQSTTNRNKKNGWEETPLLFRRQLIMKWMGEGLTKTNCVKRVMDRWGVCINASYDYVNDAIKFITQTYKEDTDHLKDIIFHKLESLVEDAMLHNDRKSALKAYDQICKMNGLYENKVEVKAETTINFDFGGE